MSAPPNQTDVPMPVPPDQTDVPMSVPPDQTDVPMSDIIIFDNGLMTARGWSNYTGSESGVYRPYSPSDETAGVISTDAHGVVQLEMRTWAEGRQLLPKKRLMTLFEHNLVPKESRSSHASPTSHHSPSEDSRMLSTNEATGLRAAQGSGDARALEEAQSPMQPIVKSNTANNQCASTWTPGVRILEAVVITERIDTSEYVNFAT